MTRKARDAVIGTVGRIRHVIWDWNGTLFDDAKLCLEIINELLLEQGLPELTQARYRALFTFPMSHYYQKIGFDVGSSSFEKLARRFLDRYEARVTECELRTGASEALESISLNGVSQSILSAYQQESLIAIIASHGLDTLFEHIVGLEDIRGASKLARGLSLVGELGHAADEVVLIGDTLHDLEVARAMGVKCLFVDGGHQLVAHLEAAGAPVLSSLSQVAALVAVDTPS